MVYTRYIPVYTCTGIYQFSYTCSYTRELHKPDDQDEIHIPAQRKLSMVTSHACWLTWIGRCRQLDQTNTGATVKHREATRAVSVSQPAAGSWLEVRVNGKNQLYRSEHVVIGLQRRSGLHLVDATHQLYDKSDPFGDSGKRDHTRVHNLVMQADRDAVAAVAEGPVILGDKFSQDPKCIDKYREYNA